MKPLEVGMSAVVHKIVMHPDVPDLLCEELRFRQSLVVQGNKSI